MQDITSTVKYTKQKYYLNMNQYFTYFYLIMIQYFHLFIDP